MKTRLLGLICGVALTGCVSYGDMHSHAKKMDPKTLTTPHQYKMAHVNPADTEGWWHRFHDPALNQLVKIALQDSPTVQTAESRVRQAEHFAEAASSTLWPAVDLSGYAQKQKFSKFGLVPPPFNGRTYNIGEVGFNFNYEFDFWGKNRETLKASISERQAAEAELAEARLILSAAVAHTWFQLCDNQAQVRIARAIWDLENESLVITTDRTQHGISSDIPVNKLVAATQAAKQQLEREQQAESLSRHQLAVLLGKNPLTTDIQAEQLIHHPVHVSVPASLPARLLADRPDIYAAKLRTEAAASRVNVAKARFFPNINLNALLSLQSVELNHLFQSQNKNNALTGAIDLPIFDAGERRASLGVSYAEYDLAVNAYNQTILTALREVADQLSAMHAVHLQLIAEDSALRATQDNYKLHALRYSQGISDFTEVLESKKGLLLQQSRQLDLQTRYAQTFVAMLKALGGKDV